MICNCLALNFLQCQRISNVKNLMTVYLLYLSGLTLSFISRESASFSGCGSLSCWGSGILFTVGAEPLLTIRVRAVTLGANH